MVHFFPLSKLPSAKHTFEIFWPGYCFCVSTQFFPEIKQQITNLEAAILPSRTGLSSCDHLPSDCPALYLGQVSAPLLNHKESILLDSTHLKPNTHLQTYLLFLWPRQFLYLPVSPPRAPSVGWVVPVLQPFSSFFTPHFPPLLERNKHLKHNLHTSPSSLLIHVIDSIFFNVVWWYSCYFADLLMGQDAGYYSKLVLSTLSIKLSIIISFSGSMCFHHLFIANVIFSNLCYKISLKDGDTVFWLFAFGSQTHECCGPCCC